MKVHIIDKKNKTVLLSIDYWEAELLGFDVKKNSDVSGSFYRTLLQIITERVQEIFGKDFAFGIKTYVDPDKGVFYYEIKPYEERLDEIIMEEMVKKQYSVTIMFPYWIQ